MLCLEQDPTFPRNTTIIIAAFGGWNDLKGHKFDIVGYDNDDYGTFDFKNGYAAGGAVGMHFLPNLRTEFELSYRSNKVSSYYEGTDATNLMTDGDAMSALALMANFWGDIPVTDNLSLHLGGGIGAAQLHLSAEDIDDGGSRCINDKDWELAGQVGAGVSYQIIQDLKINIDYRFFATGNGEFKDDLEAKGPYRNQTLLVGLTFGLGGN